MTIATAIAEIAGEERMRAFTIVVPKAGTFISAPSGRTIAPQRLRIAPSGAHDAPSTFTMSLPAMIAVIPFALS